MSEIDIKNVQPMPFGIGYIKLLFDRTGSVEDYIFIEVDHGFEKLTGRRREDVTGKRASEIFGKNRSGKFNWLSYYESVARSGKTQETEQWVGEFERNLRISVIPSDKENLAIILRDVSGALDPAKNGQAVRFPEDLEVMFNSTHDAISLVAYTGGEFRYIRNNAVHQKLTGFSDIEGTAPVALLGEKIGGKLLEYYEQCLKTGRPVTYEQKFNFSPGERVWQTEVTPVFGKDGIRYLLCSSKDISDLKEARKENELLVRRLQSMFNRHSAIMLILEPLSGRIVDANPAACEFYGYAKEELQTLSIGDINVLPAEDVNKLRMMAYKEKQHYFVFPHRLKSGEIRIVDTYSCPIADDENTLLYSIIFDVTDREKYRNELSIEKERLRTTLRSIGDGVVTTDNSGMITSLNCAAQEITGWDNSAAVGRQFSDVFVLKNEETGESVENPIQKVLSTGRIIGLANHTVLLNLKGRFVPIADSAAPIKTEDGKTFGVVMVFRDVSLEKEHSKQIEQLSYHDSLTGLYNRRYIEEAISRLDSSANYPLSVMMGDVNGLKITNDVFGHEAGDALLRHVAHQLDKYCHKGDIIARWGGDEFVVMMPHANVKEAEKIINRIKSDHIAIDQSSLSLSISLGCAARYANERSIRAVIREAEENMYHQKLLDGKSYRSAITNTLLATLYEKSMETEEHSKRIELNCHLVGRQLQLSSKEMDDLSLLAILHDIGKVGINPSILKKPSALTPAEWEEMKRHPEIGYRIVQATPELATVAEYVLSHHERWDGKGYPRGLRDKEIPLVCRILAVADAYDAMTNDRVYRRAKNSDEAVLELVKNAGTQFDPEIVKLFIQILLPQSEIKGCMANP